MPQREDRPKPEPLNDREQFDWYEYGARELGTLKRAHANYRVRGWPAPVSGDMTALDNRRSPQP